VVVVPEVSHVEVIRRPSGLVRHEGEFVVLSLVELAVAVFVVMESVGLAREASSFVGSAVVG
jgi:hypothetical protein